jgi:hypothetical protein
MNRTYQSEKAPSTARTFLWSFVSAAKTFIPVLPVLTEERNLGERLRELARDLPLTVLELPLFVFPCIVFSRVARVPALMLGAFTCAQALATWKMFQYGAPAFGLMMILILQSIRLMRRWKSGSRPTGRSLQRVTLAAYVIWPVLFYVVWPSFNPRHHFGHDRSALFSRLQADGGRHLVVVRYGPEHDVREEWVYNQADIDRAPVVWARDLGEDRNRQLLDYFKDREVWLLEPDRSPERLVAYP